MLEAVDVNFSYGGAPILSDWSCFFEAGSMSAVVGPSGRGKSTLLYLLGLMLQPQSGVVRLSGEAVSSESDGVRARLRASEFGFVFQDAALDPTRSVLDNVLESTLYRNEQRSSNTGRAMDLLARFGVDVKITAKPGQVSGGQAQRIALCRALLGRPRVILADEPTGNLDADSSQIVLDALQQHAGSGGVVVIVTHDRDVERWCDRTVEL